jgi:hypothetical protein
MKVFLLTIFSLFLTAGLGAVAQDTPNPVPRTDQVAGNRLITVMGTVRADGEVLTFVTDQRAWKVDNPETLRGHEGHYVRVTAHVYPNKGSIHITEVATPTASESRKNDAR